MQLNNRDRRISPRRRSRRGVTAVETALALLVLLPLVLGMLDFSFAVFRYHTLAESARQIARRAIVHGNRADRLGAWGPEAFEGPGGTSYLTAEADQEGIRNLLNVFGTSGVTVNAEWLDGSNEYEDRIRITTSTTYQPITPILGRLFNEIPLQGQSTMLIAH